MDARRGEHDPPSRLLFATDLVRIGAFRAAPHHPRFNDSGPIPYPVFVFPRTFVRLQHEGKRPFVAGPNVVTVYNRGQVYRRDAVDPAGDFCEWLALRDDLLLDLLGSHDPAVRDRPHAPFGALTHIPSDDLAHAEERLLIARLMATPPEQREPLAVDEAVLSILGRVAPFVSGRPLLVEPGQRQRERVERLEAVLAARFTEDLSLGELAAAAGSSPFHLCRLFRQVHGVSIHRWRRGLRLRAAVERLAAGEEDVSRLALEVGFASHSHLTAAFRTAFGLSPSALRRRASSRLLAGLANPEAGSGPSGNRSESPRS